MKMSGNKVNLLWVGRGGGWWPGVVIQIPDLDGSPEFSAISVRVLVQKS